MTVKTSRIPLSLVALPALLVAGCTSDKGDTEDPYCEPIANAGEDVSIALDTTADLDGSASGWDEGCRTDIDLTWTWTFDSVPVDSAIDDSSLTDNNSTTASVTSFTADVPGTYVLSLVVTDDLNASSPDIVVVTVTSTDAAPVADAGDDHTSPVDERVDLDGSGSYDPEGAALEYSWALSSAPSCSDLDSTDLFNSTTVSPSLICDCEGVFVASLVVSDGNNWSDPDYASIECTDGNAAPIADAGDSAELSPCTESSFELDGFGSYDTDGDEIEYLWSLVSVPADSSATDANISDTGAANPEFSWDVPGDYTFQLQVSDGEYWSAPDVVTFTVLDRETENSAPVANAGSDQSTSAEADCTSSSYVWSCEDCAAQEFDLDGSGSYDPDGDDITYTWTDTDSVLTLGARTSSTTTAWTPAMAAEYGTTTSYDFELQLDVSDCGLNDSDTVTISVECEGVKP